MQRIVEVPLRKQYAMPKLCVACGSRWDDPFFTHPTQTTGTERPLKLAFPVCSECAGAGQKAIKIHESGLNYNRSMSNRDKRRFQNLVDSVSIDRIKPKTLFRKTPIVVILFSQPDFAQQFAEANHGKLR